MLAAVCGTGVRDGCVPRRQGKENEGGARIKRFMCMMDSMTTKELDSPNPKIWTEPSRIMRVARGSGRHPQEVVELIGAPPATQIGGIFSVLCAICALHVSRF